MKGSRGAGVSRRGARKLGLLALAVAVALFCCYVAKKSSRPSWARSNRLTEGACNQRGPRCTKELKDRWNTRQIDCDLHANDKKNCDEDDPCYDCPEMCVLDKKIKCRDLDGPDCLSLASGQLGNDLQLCTSDDLSSKQRSALGECYEECNP